MTTARLGDQPGIENLVFSPDGAVDIPALGEILVRIEASSLNQHDYNVVRGRLPCVPGRILLTDAAGVVEEVGQDVDDFAVGDRVISCFFPSWSNGEPAIADFSGTPGDGVDGYARERVTRPAKWFTHSPEHLSSIEAATLPTAGLTAWRALVVEGGLKPGDTVLILGTGGVAIFALQIAKAMGATTIVTSSSDAKLHRARALGADEIINYVSTPEWSQRVLALTNGRGVDLTLEIGGPGTLPQSIAATRIGGFIGLIGVLTGISGQVPTVALMSRQQRLHGITVGSRQHQIEMVRGFQAIGLKPVVDRIFKIDKLSGAFEAMAAGEHFGKIGIDFG